jgi:hypothetical protein
VFIIQQQVAVVQAHAPKDHTELAQVVGDGGVVGIQGNFQLIREQDGILTKI